MIDVLLVSKDQLSWVENFYSGLEDEAVNIQKKKKKDPSERNHTVQYRLGRFERQPVTRACSVQQISRFVTGNGGV